MTKIQNRIIKENSIYVKRIKDKVSSNLECSKHRYWIEATHQTDGCFGWDDNITLGEINNLVRTYGTIIVYDTVTGIMSEHSLIED